MLQETRKIIRKNMIRTDGTSKHEEIANAVSHGIGVPAAGIGVGFLIVSVMKNGNAGKTASICVFGSTLILMYLISTLFHSLSFTRARNVFRILDHSSISLLIAGSYTPVVLGLKGIEGISILAVAWIIAFSGILITVFFPRRMKLLLAIYLASGWLAIVAIKPIAQTMRYPGVWYMLAGGIFYTVGTVFYSWKKLVYHHGIWHLFVMAGSACHLFMMFHLS